MVNTWLRNHPPVLAGVASAIERATTAVDNIVCPCAREEAHLNVSREISRTVVGPMDSSQVRAEPQ